jgi:dTDP-6-deoxy-L-talose 4-dehydrogenase (NAD+)
VSIRSLVERWVKERSSTIQLDLGRYAYPDHEPMAFWGARERLDALLVGATIETR